MGSPELSCTYFDGRIEEGLPSKQMQPHHQAFWISSKTKADLKIFKTNQYQTLKVLGVLV